MDVPNLIQIRLEKYKYKLQRLFVTGKTNGEVLSAWYSKVRLLSGFRRLLTNSWCTKDSCEVHQRPLWFQKLILCRVTFLFKRRKRTSLGPLCLGSKRNYIHLWVLSYQTVLMDMVWGLSYEKNQVLLWSSLYISVIASHCKIRWLSFHTCSTAVIHFRLKT